jgi:hypothetical protein
MQLIVHRFNMRGYLFMARLRNMACTKQFAMNTLPLYAQSLQVSLFIQHETLWSTKTVAQYFLVVGRSRL